MNSPARLSSEVLINLAENGVKSDTLARLMVTALHDRLDPLLNWDNSLESHRVLWDNVAKEGSVFSARLSRLHSSYARALGLRYEDPEENVEDDLDATDELLERSSAWWGDPISGQPSSLEETVLNLLDSGFTPADSSILQGKLAEVARKAVKSCIGKFKVEIQQSCTAFIVPGKHNISISYKLYSYKYTYIDPCGVLEPGEVQIKCSSRSLIDCDGNPTDIILGDVLVSSLCLFQYLKSHYCLVD